MYELATVLIIVFGVYTYGQAMAENLNGMSREELTELVRYHMVPSRVKGTGLHNDRQLMTMSSADKRLLVKRYHSVCCRANQGCLGVNRISEGTPSQPFLGPIPSHSLL